MICTNAMLDQKQESLILLNKKQENYQKQGKLRKAKFQSFVVFCSMCYNLGHLPLLFPAFDTSFSFSNEVGNAISRPLEKQR